MKIELSYYPPRDTFLEISNIKKEQIYKISLLEIKKDINSTRIYDTLLMRDEYIIKMNLYFDKFRFLGGPWEEIKFLNGLCVYLKYSDDVKLFKLNNRILKT